MGRELIRAMKGGLKYWEVLSPVQMAVSVAIQKKDLMFFTKIFQKVLFSEQLVIVPIGLTVSGNSLGML